MNKFCPLTLTYMNENLMLRISDNKYVHRDTFKKYILYLNLGINIDLATEEEWVITARSDTFDNSNIIRLRNPLTNLPFTDNELKNIYNELTTSNFR
jgi:hypothetical protein